MQNKQVRVLQTRAKGVNSECGILQSFHPKVINFSGSLMVSRMLFLDVGLFGSLTRGSIVLGEARVPGSGCLISGVL